MVAFDYLTLQSFIDKNFLDDDARWWIELWQTPELNPIRKYTFDVIEEPYQHNVSLDLDVRVRVLLELINDAEYNKRCNKTYLKKLVARLQKSCVRANRTDLVEILNNNCL